MTDDAKHQIATRVIGAYSSALSLLGLISTGGLAAAGAILQTDGHSNWLIFVSAIAFFISLVTAFFATNCLIGQAKKEDPVYTNKYLVWSASIAGISMLAGILFLLISFVPVEAGRKYDKSCNCLCNSPTSVNLGQSNQESSLTLPLSCH